MKRFAVVKQEEAFRVIDTEHYPELRDTVTLLVCANGEFTAAAEHLMETAPTHVLSAFKTSVLERENRDLKEQLEQYWNTPVECDCDKDVEDEKCDTAEDGPSLEDRVAVLEQAIIDLTAAPYVPPHYPGTCPGIPQQYPTYPTYPYIQYH